MGYATKRIGIWEGHNCVCEYCKKPFYRTPSAIKKAKRSFCTLKCYAEVRRHVFNGAIKKEVI